MTSPGLPADDTLARILLDSIQDEAVFALDAAGVVVNWNSGADLLQIGHSASSRESAMARPERAGVNQKLTAWYQGAPPA
ncbi:MAG TPA: hypothetical protein VE913_19345 [Longimicrobium sp.]|nr:hypothetical protein [Longimicrobium sp.]